ncbi:MAG: carboxypeptidase regulatory-like domain-containing protein [Planctomycetia bacterium]|nr:carboxypeptidase regulatory-like domain-containing protein [Planctomycetia bacterium]
MALRHRVVLGVGTAIALAVGVGTWIATRPAAAPAPAATAESPDAGGASFGSAAAPPPPLVGSARAADVPTGRGVVVATVRGADGPLEATVTLTWRGPEPLGQVLATATLIRELSRPAEPPRPTRVATTAADGRATFAGLAVGRYDLRATTADGRSAAAEAVLAADGARATVDLRPTRGDAVLVGRVLDAAGRPFRGTVTVAPFDGVLRLWDGPPETPVTLDGEGAFRAAGLVAGNVVLIARDGGARRATSEAIAVPRAEPFDFRVGAGSTSRDVRVIADADERPVEGAVVLTVGASEHGASVAARTTTDRAGLCRVEVPSFQGSLRVVAPGFVPRRVVTTGAPTNGTAWTIRLSRGASLVGRVTTAADARPVAGLAVRVIRETGGSDFFPRPAVATDVDGRYALEELEPGPATVFVEGDGWSTSGIVERSLLESLQWRPTLRAGETTTLDLRVVPTTTAQGVVRDAADRPVAFATVRAVGRQGPRNYVSWGAIENSTVAPVVTAQDGTFTLTNLAVGAQYVCTATAEDGSTGRSGFVPALADGTTRIEIRVTPVRRLALRIVDADDGTPIPKATVHVAMKRWVIDDDPINGTAGPDGIAVLELRVEGDATVIARAPGYLASEGQPVEALATEATIPLRRGYVITGRVVGADGAPVNGAEVEARDPHAPLTDPVQVAWANAEGRFEFAVATPGPRELSVEATVGDVRLEAVATAETGGPPATLTLAPAMSGTRREGVIVLHVVGPDGRDIPSARVEYHAEPSAPTGVASRGPVTGEWVVDGRATLRVGTRKVRVLVHSPAGRDQAPLPFAAVTLAGLAARKDVVEVRMPMGKSIDGIVRGPDGTPMAQLAIFARRLASTPGVLGTPSAQTATGSDGRFRIVGLEDGAYGIDLFPPRGLRWSRSIQAPAGATGLELRLEAGVAALFTVLDPVGRPVVGASVEAETVASLETGAGYDRAQTDPNGHARLERLAPAQRYEVTVTPTPGSGFARASLGNWTPQDTTVRLGTARTVRGRVRDATGRPISEVGIEYADEEEWDGYVVSENDGTFTLEDVGGGDVRLVARIEGLGFDRGAETVVKAGETSVDVVLDPGHLLRVSLGTAWADRRVVWFDPSTSGPQRVATEVDESGIATVRVRDPDRAYGIWVPPDDDGQSLLRTDVRRGDPPPRLTLARGHAIRVKVTAPPGAERVVVRAFRFGGRVVARGALAADGTYEILGLPAGEWTVEAEATIGGRESKVTATAPTGGTADLTLD